MMTDDASQGAAGSAQLREQVRPDTDLAAGHRKCSRKHEDYELLDHDENVEPPDEISQGESPRTILG